MTIENEGIKMVFDKTDFIPCLLKPLEDVGWRFVIENGSVN